MKYLRRVWAKVLGGLGVHRPDGELSEELSTHVELLTEENVRAGMNRTEARRQACLRFGALTSTHEACREQRGLPRIEAFMQDLRHAGRTLGNARGFTLTVVLTLGVAIGANTAIFSLVNQALFQLRGVDQPERIVSAREHYGKLNLDDLGVTSGPAFADILRSRDVFEHAAALISSYRTLTGGAEPEHIQAANVSSEWFEVLGAKPYLGRTFTAEEDQPNASRVVVLSYATWDKLFGRDPAVLNRTIELDLQPYKIIGVMNPGIEWIGPADVWVPLALAPAAFVPQERFHEYLFTLAKLRPGVSQEQANAWFKLLAARVLASAPPDAKDIVAMDWTMFSKSLTRAMVGDTRTPMLVLLGSVGIILLIAASNVAGLMLARIQARAHELAIQAALGASRGRMMSRIFAESLILMALGTALGLPLAYLGMKILLQWVPQNALPGLAVRYDTFTLGFTAVIVALAGFLFGAVPAWMASGASPIGAMRSEGRTVTGRQRMRSVLVVAETALALVLMVAAGSLLRSFSALEQVQPGFEPGGVMTASVSFPAARYDSGEKQWAFYRSVLDRLPPKSAIASSVPFQGGLNAGSFEVRGVPANDGNGRHADVRFVSPGFFEALGIPVRNGRTFARSDTAESERVAVIDEKLAKQFWPGENPVGKQLRPAGLPEWFTIVGVVGHVRQAELASESPRGTLYYSLYQARLRMSMAVVASHAPADLIRSAVTSADPAESTFDVESLGARVADSLASRRFVLRVESCFAAVALFLAALGLYGVISYAVSQRTREVGIRMALGAPSQTIIRSVLGEGLRLAVIGTAIGLAAAAGLARAIESQLFRVRVFDTENIAVAIMILFVVAALASLLPARRAAAVDPITALR